jgi:amino acid permease
VTFALARDGLAFRSMSTMSSRQAPIVALAVVTVFGVILVLNRSFEKALEIYYFASAVLFGLAYASLIVFRRRDRRTGFQPVNDTPFKDRLKASPTFFRCPAGPLLAGLLILVQIANAVGIAMNNPRDAVYSAALLAGIAALYGVWKKLKT